MKSLYRFFHSDAMGGIVLMVAAALALIVANSPWAYYYNAFLDQTITFGLTTPEGKGTLAFQKPMLLWINDWFMAIFFLFVGLEIKREFSVGALSSKERATLPLIAAIGGMVIPGVIFFVVAMGNPDIYQGWAIPMATDIAFALGVLALASSRLPLALKVLLTAIAVMDDLGAILIIAFFYTDTIVVYALWISVFATLALIALNRMKVAALGPYFLIGTVLWIAMFKAGVHPTLAGVIMAFTIPMMDEDRAYSPVEQLEHLLKPWVVFFILPIFSFANAGVSFSGIGWNDVFQPLTVAIALGLFIGKQIGVFGFVYAAVKLGVCERPNGISWPQIYGISLLCGIGFTMSLFIGDLAFQGQDSAAMVRIGVIGGSVLSAVMGFIVLKISARAYEAKNSL